MLEKEYVIVKTKSQLHLASTILRAVDATKIPDADPTDLVKVIHILEKWRDEMWKQIKLDKEQN